MIGSVTPNLPARLLGYLRPGAPALLLTSGADGITDLIARHQLPIVVATLDTGALHAQTRALIPRIEAAAPNVIMLWEMEVMGARDQSWRGVKTTALMYEWPAEQREAMLRMEQAVYAEMRAAIA